MVNESINGQEITPNLNRLTKNSLLFSKYHEQVNTGVSSDADFLTNTSTYPIRKGSTFYQYPFNTYSLPKLLNNLEYHYLIY